MRIGIYNIENVSSDFVAERKFKISITHKYWYLWNIWIELKYCHLFIEITRTDWNKSYKNNCKNYQSKRRHCMNYTKTTKEIRNMEEINNKAYDDELNKAHEEIHETPRIKIPTPKVVNEKKEKKNYGRKR